MKKKRLFWVATQNFIKMRFLPVIIQRLFLVGACRQGRGLRDCFAAVPPYRSPFFRLLAAGRYRAESVGDFPDGSSLRSLRRITASLASLFGRSSLRRACVAAKSRTRSMALLGRSGSAPPPRPPAALPCPLPAASLRLLAPSPTVDLHPWWWQAVIPKWSPTPILAFG